MACICHRRNNSNRFICKALVHSNIFASKSKIMCRKTIIFLENCKKKNTHTQEHEYIMRLSAINQAQDNESVKMLNYFREHCVFDHGFESTMKAHFLLQMLPAECGLTVKNKRERATRESWLASTGSPGVFSSTQPTWPYCVSKQIEWLAV